MNCIRLLRLAERQAPNILNIASPKYISHHRIKYMETQDRWRQRDGLTKEWQLIYKGPMDKILQFVTTYLTVSTATVGACGLYYGLFVFDNSDLNTPVILGEDVVIANSAAECLVYIAAFTVFHIAIKVLLSKFVVRLYQNGDDYLAIFRGHIYNSITKHKFNVKEVKKLKPTLVVSWGDARFGLGKKHAILLENYFKTPEYFNYLLSSGEKPSIEE